MQAIASPKMTARLRSTSPADSLWPAAPPHPQSIDTRPRAILTMMAAVKSTIRQNPSTAPIRLVVGKQQGRRDRQFQRGQDPGGDHSPAGRGTMRYSSTIAPNAVHSRMA